MNTFNNTKQQLNEYLKKITYTRGVAIMRANNETASKKTRLNISIIYKLARELFNYS